MIFDKWWVDLEQEVTTALSDPQLEAPPEHRRDQADLLEELLLRTRDIQQALENRTFAEPARGFSQRSVRDMLEQMLSKLSPQQLSMLLEFVTPAGTPRVLDARELEARYSKADIDALVQSGILARHKDSLLLFHDVMARYIGEAFPAR
jgi:hypothetical protein